MNEQINELPEDGLKSSPKMSRYIGNTWISDSSFWWETESSY